MEKKVYSSLPKVSYSGTSQKSRIPLRAKSSAAKDGSGVAGIQSYESGKLWSQEMQAASKELEKNLKSLDEVHLRELDDVIRGAHEEILDRHDSALTRLFEGVPAKVIQERSKEREEALQRKLDDEVKKLEHVQRDLEKEKEKSLCSICFSFPRDTVVLNCMHFQYCSNCMCANQLSSNRCPTCRGNISGVLKLNLNI
ncbi:hypothetical protein AXG93_955s1060 [Marchantia polymorpha subsp. ruderalis]|uniref:RING-type domain-containing protein n=1 Tax=Marchantia polymorpha subsp. ruderalis TaxID=1480154 RepID=A0A176WI01_MARPO|nr:hypothetical protein AXG93_955s1060 [Marchantia polymorpha subsp. ruderalis]